MIADIERARRALQAIPPDVPRDEWVRVLMAGQAAGLDADELRAWSEQGNTYEARAFADTMRSIKPGKGIGAGTLHRLAAEHGHQSPSEAPIRPVVRPQTVRQGFTLPTFGAAASLLRHRIATWCASWAGVAPSLRSCAYCPRMMHCASPGKAWPGLWPCPPSLPMARCKACN